MISFLILSVSIFLFFFLVNIGKEMSLPGFRSNDVSRDVLRPLHGTASATMKIKVLIS